MKREGLFENLKMAVENFDMQSATNLAQRIIDMDINPIGAIEMGLIPGLKVIGDKFSSGEYFLPELVRGATVVKEAMHILEQKLAWENVKLKGTVVIGSVKGDIHDIGKNLVGTMLSAAGFRVVDIGIDCSADQFINKALEVNADVIGASALLTMTVSKQKELIDRLNEKGLRNKFKVVVGGAAVDPSWAIEIGADGYGENAFEAVTMISSLLGNKL